MNPELHVCETPPDPGDDSVLGYLVRTVHRLDVRTAVDHDKVKQLYGDVYGEQGIQRQVIAWRAQIRLLAWLATGNSVAAIGAVAGVLMQATA